MLYNHNYRDAFLLNTGDYWDDLETMEQVYDFDRMYHMGGEPYPHPSN